MLVSWPSIFSFKFEPLDSFDHLLDLHLRGEIGSGTICRVKRNYKIIKFYFHYFTIVEVAHTSVDIIHLCSSVSTIRCEQRTVKFNASNDPEFDFSSGVSFCCGGAFPLNETWIKDVENRIREMMSMVYIPYSLVNDSKWHCQSLAYYISTGEKKNTEPSDFINRCSVSFLSVTLVSVVSILAVLHGIGTSTLIYPVKFKNILKIVLKRIKNKMIEKINETGRFIIWIIRYIPFYFLPFFRKLWNSDHLIAPVNCSSVCLWLTELLSVVLLTVVNAPNICRTHHCQWRATQFRSLVDV